MSFKIPFVGIIRQNEALKSEFYKAFDEIFASGSFILRQHVADFEAAMAKYLGVKHVIGVNSGTDALMLSVKAAGVGPGDEVITVPHTFVATLAAIAHAGAKPVLVDVRDDFNMDPDQLEAAITPRTRAIMPVHMNGRACDMDPIMDIAASRNLVVIEDVAQALGARYKGRHAGTFGLTGCYSLHPMKNLSVPGDGGFVATNDPAMDEKLRLLRDHGQRLPKTREELEFYGYNSRLDNMWAAIASIKFVHFPGWLDRRRGLAGRYQQALGGIAELTLPSAPSADDVHHDVYSSYVVLTDRRDELQQYLLGQGIEVFAQMRKPLHFQSTLGLGEYSLPTVEGLARRLLSLPLYPELTDAEQDVVIAAVKKFFGNAR